MSDFQSPHVVITKEKEPRLIGLFSSFHNGSQVVIQVARGIALWISKQRDRGVLAITITTTEDQHRKRLPFQFVPVNRHNLPSDELLVMLAFDVGGLAHAASPTCVSSNPCSAFVCLESSARLLSSSNSVNTLKSDQTLRPSKVLCRRSRHSCSTAGISEP